MKNNELFKHLRVPEPPGNLRESVIAEAKLAFKLQHRVSWTSRFLQNRVALSVWAAALGLCVFSFLFWNPPLPGSHVNEVTLQPSESVEGFVLNPVSPLLSAGLRNPRNRNSMEGMDL